MFSSLELQRVMVVDDERLIADSFALILQSRGYQTRVAYDAEEAITIAAEFDPQAVISDVVMPGMNGLDLAVYLSEHHPQCKMLLISGNAAASALLDDAARQGHYHQILPKPIHPLQLLEFLASCATVA